MADSNTNRSNIDALHDEINVARNQLRLETFKASVPLIVESLALLTDSIKDLRTRLEHKHTSDTQCAPLEAELRAKQLEEQLEDLKNRRQRAREDHRRNFNTAS